MLPSPFSELYCCHTIFSSSWLCRKEWRSTISESWKNNDSNFCQELNTAHDGTGSATIEGYIYYTHVCLLCILLFHIFNFLFEMMMGKRKIRVKLKIKEVELDDPFLFSPTYFLSQILGVKVVRMGRCVGCWF